MLNLNIESIVFISHLLLGDVTKLAFLNGCCLHMLYKPDMWDKFLEIKGFDRTFLWSDEKKNWPDYLSNLIVTWSLEPCPALSGEAKSRSKTLFVRAGLCWADPCLQILAFSCALKSSPLLVFSWGWRFVSFRAMERLGNVAFWSDKFEFTLMFL